MRFQTGLNEVVIFFQDLEKTNKELVKEQNLDLVSISKYKRFYSLT